MNQQAAVSNGGVQLPRSVSETERKLREELAAAFKVAHYLGWNTGVHNHITLRIPETDTFLMNPIGFAWHEITADSLVTVNFDRQILSHSGVRIAVAGFNFHGGILKKRPDIHSIIHTHARAGLFMSTLQEPLVILDQSGCSLHGEVGYHAFEGFVDQADEVPRILSDLGNGHTLIMKNHGLLSVGESIGGAFGWMRLLIDACELYERALASGRPIQLIPDDVQRDVKAKFTRPNNEPWVDANWPYFLRLAKQLDNQALRTFA